MDSPKLTEVVKSYKLLTEEWNKKPTNLQKCGQILTRLKIALTQLTFLPTINNMASKKEILVARDILELGAQWSIAVKDIPSFERYMAQLKCYYFDYQKDLPTSAFKFELLGLNLLCLLAQNRVAEFHTELELLPAEEIKNSPYIKHPVSMEQYLMEGSYNKVFNSKGSVPASSYNYFIDILLDTVRDEIAACIEKAYEKINFNEAARLLFFKTTQEMTDYATKRQWTMNKKLFVFNTEVKHVTDTIPAKEYASQAIIYARELEMIV